MKTSTQLVLFLLLSYPLWSFASSTQAVSSVCSHTHDPKLCTSTSIRFANSFRVIDSKAVLQMHLRATSKRAASAKNNVSKIAGRYPPEISNALRSCGHLYGNIIDLIGVCIRAIDANDQQTKIMVQISLSEVTQSIQQCDMSFQKMAAKNPMTRFDASLLKMSTNCNDLTNMI